MDPPPKPKSVASSRPPRPPRRNTAPQFQLSRRPPQESSPEIQESQVLPWFQEIFPGQDLPPCLQPETENDPPRDDTLQRMQSLPRSNPVPWHKSRERLLLRELYPHLDALCTDSISRKRQGLQPPRPPRPRPQAISFLSLDSPPRSSPPHQQDIVPAPPQQEIVLAPPSPLRSESQEVHGPHSIASPSPSSMQKEPAKEPVRSPPARKASPRCWIFVVILVVIIIVALALVRPTYFTLSFIVLAASTITHGDDCCFRCTFFDVIYTSSFDNYY